MSRAPIAIDALSTAEVAGILFAIDPLQVGGVVLRGPHGTTRDRWLDSVRALGGDSCQWWKLPPGIAHDRLLGGIDLAATLRDGEPRYAQGILARANHGVVQIAMAERLEPGAAACISNVMDRGYIHRAESGGRAAVPASFGVIAQDEGIDDEECLDAALADRLALRVDLDAVDVRTLTFAGCTPGAIDAARARVSRVHIDANYYRALAGTAMALGIHSARGELFAVRVAKTIAACRAADEVNEMDVALAARLVFAHRATVVPAPPEAADEQQDQDRQPEPPPDDGRSNDAQDLEIDDLVLEAVTAALPRGLLDNATEYQRNRSASAGRGRAGTAKKRLYSGRPVGSADADRLPNGRINVLATLKAALPWQTIRRRQTNRFDKLHIRKSDLQVTRFKDRNESTTLFVVDASGSQAAQRLGEVKGAIELLLADCYVRRDQVALIVFRGTGAELVLAPTRALVRAKRTLAAMPGGGGTPLSAGINKARELVDAIRRDGRTPRVVFLTDGRANVSSDGSTGHELATDEAKQAARLFRQLDIRPIVVDTSRRPRTSARELASELAAFYLPLPYADARSINQSIQRIGRQ